MAKLKDNPKQSHFIIKFLRVWRFISSETTTDGIIKKSDGRDSGQQRPLSIN